jgi:hypothetical protein
MRRNWSGQGWDELGPFQRTQRLQEAANSGHLSTHVKVSHLGMVGWRHPELSDAGPDGVIRHLFRVAKRPHSGNPNLWRFGEWSSPDSYDAIATNAYRTREEAVRAGLLALAEREEATQ